MKVFAHQVGVFEEEINGFNKRSLGLEDLKNLCQRQDLILLMEPLPCQGIYLCQRGVPTITVNSRLDRNTMLFTGFWTFFLHCLRPGETQVLETNPDWSDRVLLSSAILASMALVPNSRLQRHLALYNQAGPFAELFKNLIDSRIHSLLNEQRPCPAAQAL